MGAPAWISGGSGVDASVGRQTRIHRDLELGVEAAHEAAGVEVPGRLDHRVATDRRSVRVEVVAAGRVPAAT